MERSENAGFNPDTGSEQSAFGDSGTNGQTSFANSDATRPSNADVSSTFRESESGGIRDRVKNVASTVKDKASTLPAIIADGLESGAKALRQKRPTGEQTSGGSVALTNDSSITAVTDTLASGMQSSAEWLREADMEKIKSGVENQVKEHPARSLLIALGAGYLIGKALRR
jgi:hypothetical protein